MSASSPLAGLRPVHLPPSRVVVAGALLAFVLVAALAWLATLWPWLGLRLVPGPDGVGLRVAAVESAGPAMDRLRPGDVIVAAEGGADRIALDAVLIARATYVLPSYPALDAFVDEHRRLHAMLGQGRVHLVRDDGTRVEVHASGRRPLHALPLDFWAPALLAGASLFMAFGVIAFGERRAQTRFFFVSALAYAGTLSTMALALGREISFDGDWATPMWSLNQACRLSSHWALLMVFWVYPRPFRPLRWSLPIAAAFLLAGIANEWRWWPRPFVAAPLMSALTILVALPLLASWQWRVSRDRPLDRAVVKVMIVSLAGPALLLISLNQVPNMLWQRPLIESAAAIAAISAFTYVGCLVGIARYRLFDLGRWFFEAMVWALGGALVLLLDALLLWFNASLGVALGAALAIAGWLYFPLRQWLWRRLGAGAGQSLDRHLPQLIDGLFGARTTDELHAGWQRLLERVFAPLHSRVVDAAAAAPGVEAEGLRLRVPALEAGRAIELAHADKGRRLFGNADAELAARLLALTQRAAEARRALDAGAAERAARQREKEVLLQDLHDGLGGIATNIRLLATRAQADASVLPKALDTISDLADESLSEIRGFMYSLDESDPSWQALAADLRAFGSRIVEPHGLAFTLEADLADDGAVPDSLLRLNLARICKEALTNVVKHARASRVDVRLRVSARGLEVRIADDGVGLPAGGAPVGRSRGLANLRRRAQQLGATLVIDGAHGTTLSLSMPLPLNSPASGMPDERAAA